MISARPASASTLVSRRLFLIGVLYVIGYVIVGTAGEVFAAAVFQTNDIYSQLLIAFLLVAVVFNLMPRKRSAKISGVNLRTLVYLNASTAVSWLGLFIGLKYVEPAIVVSFVASLGPVATVWLNSSIRQEGPPPGSDLIASGLIAVVGGYMIWVLASGNAAMAWDARTIYGLAASICAGFSVAMTNVLVKRLFDLKMDNRSILAHRFYGTIVVLLLLVDYGIVWGVIATNIVNAVLIGLSTIIVPILLIQAGIKRIEPLVVNTILASSPLLTFVFQYFDSRLSQSFYTVVGNLMIVCIVIWSVHSHARRIAA